MVGVPSRLENKFAYLGRTYIVGVMVVVATIYVQVSNKHRSGHGLVTHVLSSGD